MFSLQASRLRGSEIEHVLMFGIGGMWEKKSTQRQNHMKYIWSYHLNLLEKMVIDRRNCCRFFPVDIAGYEKWHLVVAIFCSQKNKPQLFCIECSANVSTYLFCFSQFIQFYIFAEAFFQFIMRLQTITPEVRIKSVCMTLKAQCVNTCVFFVR